MTSKILNNSIKAASTALILLFLLLTIYSFVTVKDKKIRKLIYTSHMPAIINGKDVVFDINSSIIYKETVILYEIMPNHYQLFNEKDSLIRDTIKYKYLIVKEGEKIGFFYDSLSATKYRKINADSILFKTSSILVREIYDKKSFSLIKTNKNKEGYPLIETYYNNIKNHTSADTMKVYYTNGLKNTEHSLSKYLDSINKLKVCKISGIFGPLFLKEYSKTVQRTEFWFSIKEDTVSNLSKYDDFINAFNSKYTP